MDRFLARKHMPFKNEHQNEAATVLCLLLKSWYTLTRQAAKLTQYAI